LYSLEPDLDVIVSAFVAVDEFSGVSPNPLEAVRQR